MKKKSEFDVFAEAMRGKWEAEERYFRALEAASERMFQRMLDLDKENVKRFAERLCPVDERLKPPCQ